MTARQARRERREAERKTKNAEWKRQHAEALGGIQPNTPSALGAGASESGFGFVSQNAPNPSKPDTSSLPRSSTYRAEINRRNAQHSTGPHSPDGKLASSRNSFKHGLASGELIIQDEDPSDFDALLTDLLAGHRPANSTEEILVNQMAQAHWLSRRAIRLQADCFLGYDIDEKRLALLLRYQTTHERAFHKALATLMKLKKERERGFVAQNAGDASSTTGFVSQNEDQTPAEEHVSTDSLAAVSSSFAPSAIAQFVSPVCAST